MEDLLIVTSILLAVVSATLAIAAFVFGWVSFRNTSKMQTEIQAILAKVSEKVEVVAERTSHQIDRAWDYFTRSSPDSGIDISEHLAKKEEELKKRLKEETRKETLDAIKEAGLDKSAVEGLVSRIESIVARSSELTKAQAEQALFLNRLSQVESTTRSLAMSAGVSVERDTPLAVLADNLHLSIVDAAREDLKALAATGNRTKHADVPPEEIKVALKTAQTVLSYLRNLQGRFGPVMR